MIGLLLDTHAALFWWAGSAKLSVPVRQIILAADVEVYVSAASGWEIATKFRTGKLAFASDPETKLPELMGRHAFQSLEVRMEHAVRAGLLPGDHRDPFDRIIAAQALIEGLTVATRDPAIAAFGCKVLW